MSKAFDFVFLKSCDHLLKEQIVPEEAVGCVLFNVTAEIDSLSPMFRLFKNGVDITSSVKMNRWSAYVIQVIGLTYSSSTYPQDDYDVVYRCVTSLCPKCGDGHGA